MVTIQGMKTLQERKQKLVLQSEVNRRILGLEMDVIRLQVTQWKGLKESIPTLPGSLNWLAPAVGFLGAWRKRGVSDLWGKGILGLLAFYRLRPLLKWFLRKRSGTKESSD